MDGKQSAQRQPYVDSLDMSTGNILRTIMMTSRPTEFIDLSALIIIISQMLLDASKGSDTSDVRWRRRHSLGSFEIRYFFVMMLSPVDIVLQRVDGGLCMRL